MSSKIAEQEFYSLRNSVKTFSLHRLLSSSFDVVGIQETHWATDDDCRLWNGYFPSFHVYSCLGTSKRCGVAILVAKRLHATVIRRSAGSEERLVSLTLSVNDFEFSVTSVYCPCPSAESPVFRLRFGTLPRPPQSFYSRGL